MGESIVFATATCLDCGEVVGAYGWHQEFKDVTSREEFMRGELSQIPGLVEWQEWRHLPEGPIRDRAEPRIHPASVVPTSAGKAILAGDMRPVGGCGTVGHPAAAHVCQIGGVPVDFDPIKPEPAAEIVHRYPHTVKWSDVENFLRTIGVDPIDKQSMNLVSIEPDGVTFRRFREMPGDKAESTKYVTAIRRPAHAGGKPYGYGDAATQITTAQIRWDE